jgi:type II secretory pathway pseudopilin PulG
MNKPKRQGNGFTLVELLVGSVIMLAIILLTLTLYTRSNRISVDQQQLSDVQHETRFAMYYISRDIKNAGAGLPQEFAGYFLQGVNNDQNQKSGDANMPGYLFQPDSLTILGNSDPLRLLIQGYNPGTGLIQLEATQLSLYPYNVHAYPTDSLGYINRLILILPNPEMNTLNGELGKITNVDFGANQVSFTRINVSLPNNLQPGGDAAAYNMGTVNFIEFRKYWLDINGSYTGLVAGQDGYLGIPGVLYLSQYNTLTDRFEHMALAQSVEDFQIQYLGDLDHDGNLDDYNHDGVIDNQDYQNWDNANWTNNPGLVLGIRSLRFWILGKTDRAFTSISGLAPGQMSYVFGKPALADSSAGSQADKHRRVLLESTISIRNMCLGLYNMGR